MSPDELAWPIHGRSQVPAAKSESGLRRLGTIYPATYLSSRGQMQAHAFRRHLMTWSGLGVVPLARPGERVGEKRAMNRAGGIFPLPAPPLLPACVRLPRGGGWDTGSGMLLGSGLDSSGTVTEGSKS